MIVAIIALIATIGSAFLGSLIAEDYRRFRDGQGTAASLLGELTGYDEGSQLMLSVVAAMKSATAAGKVVAFKVPDPARDVLYETHSKNLGLLGTDAAKDVAYVYQRLNGFRATYTALARTHETLSPADVIGSLGLCEIHLQVVRARTVPLLKRLEDIATADYTWPRLPKWKRTTREDW